MENKQKRGITIVTLVITVIILTVLTGAVMLTMVGDNGIFGETQTTVDKYNKQAMIDEIKLKIQKKKLSNIEKGQYTLSIENDVKPILANFGTYEENTLKLTTNEKNMEIYLYEIMEISAGEYVTATYIDKVLTLTEKEESLSSNGYRYEYTYDNGVIWQTYINPTTIQEQTGIKVRITNSEGQVISNEYVVTKGAGEETVNKIKQIAITNPPTKVTYKQGETFSASGMQITVTYEDNTRKVVTNYNYTPTRALTVSDRYITISYTENGVTKQTTQNITVTNKLTAIGITELKKTNYKQGETINKSDIVVKATYEDNTNKQVTNFTYEPTGALQASDTSITVTYTEGTETKTASKDIQVTYITALEITSEPSVEFKTTYIKGEDFDPTGLIVSVIYEDKNALPVTNYEIVNGTNLQVGTNEIVIRYTEGGITVEKGIPITVTNNVTGIVVTKGPNKTTYNHNEEFDKTGMIVTLNYQYVDDSRTLQESEYTVSMPTYGQNYVTITHIETGMTTTQAVTVTYATLASQIDKDNYGDTVAYDPGNGVTDWKIFYENDSGNVFLITSGYLPTSKIPSGVGLTATGDYTAYWSGVPALQTITDDTRALFMETVFPLNSSNNNTKYISTLLNTNNWIGFVDERYAISAIGSPTLEMFISSWNAKDYTTIYFANGGSYGYSIGWNPNPSGETAIVLDIVDELYCPLMNEQYFAYYLSSPGQMPNVSYLGSNIWYINSSDRYFGHVNIRYWGSSRARGLRPVVCLDTDVQAYWNGTTWILQ